MSSENDSINSYLNRAPRATEDIFADIKELILTVLNSKYVLSGQEYPTVEEFNPVYNKLIVQLMVIKVQLKIENVSIHSYLKFNNNFTFVIKDISVDDKFFYLIIPNTLDEIHYLER